MTYSSCQSNGSKDSFIQVSPFRLKDASNSVYSPGVVVVKLLKRLNKGSLFVCSPPKSDRNYPYDVTEMSVELSLFGF